VTWLGHIIDHDELDMTCIRTLGLSACVWFSVVGQYQPLRQAVGYIIIVDPAICARSSSRRSPPISISMSAYLEPYSYSIFDNARSLSILPPLKQHDLIALC